VKSKTWKIKIKKACEGAGTYRPFFDNVIDTLSGILEMRDQAIEQYEASGSKPVVCHTNKARQTNLIKNPALVVIDDMNKTALAYWRDLGLTPAGLKKIDEKLMKPQKKSTFESLLSGLDKE
jgi:hypothetical protein